MPGRPRTHARLPYRPALDGVRAVAVLGVLLYHGGVPWVPGGFLGVDLFFVLSGFLITSLLLQEHVARQRILLGTFWFRRARRLLPAMFAMVAFVCAYAAWLAPDLVRTRLRGDLWATLAYVANWRFVVDDISYFERYSSPNPLLHMWSLAIEEQFYLVWPFVVLFLMGPLRRRFGPRAGAWAIAGLIVASTAWMAVLSTTDASQTRLYVGTDTRAHTLLVGALAAWLVTRARWWTTDSSSTAPRWVGLVSALSLLAVVGSFVVVHDGMPSLFRGGFLAAAIAGLGLVVGSAHPGSHPVSRLLGTRPLRLIGERSYGLYLWHWPLFVVLTPARLGMGAIGVLTLRLLATFVVAWASYHVIERPIRRWRPGVPGSPWTPAVVFRFAGAAAACALLASLATGAPRPVPARAGAPRPLPSLSASITTGRPLSVFLLGDSVAHGLHTEYPPSAPLALQASGYTRLGCTTLLPGEIASDGRIFTQPAGCADVGGVWPQVLARSRHDLAVVMVGNGELFDHVVDGRTIAYGSPEYADLLRQWLDRTFAIMRTNADHLALTTVPCFARPDFGVDPSVRVVNDPNRPLWVNETLRDYAAAHPDVHLLDLRAAVCPKGVYTRDIDGVRMRKDGVHWTGPGAEWVWRWFAAEVRNSPWLENPR